MAGPCLLSDGQSFSSGGGNAPGQSGGWNAVVSEHIHRTVQPAAPAIRAPVQWPLQILDRRGERQWLLAVTQNHPPGVESRGFKITHPEKAKGLANRLWSGADFGHVKLSQDGLGQRNSGTQKQRLVEAVHRSGTPDRPADRAQTYSGRFKFTSGS